MLFLKLTKGPGNSMIRQIYEQLRGLILSGSLKSGEKLPSSRTLAQELNISRNTVMISYDMLISEGLIESRAGSGFYVSPDASYKRVPAAILDYTVTVMSAAETPADTVSFDSGTPALELFPRSRWVKTAADAFNGAPVSALGYDYPGGRPEFKRTLAAYLKRTRGIDCGDDQIIITTGVKQGLTLLAKCLLDPSKEAWLEDPTNANVRKIFSFHTEHITPVPVDEKGIRTDLFPTDRSPALIFVTPSHQFPMGGILPIQRRLELIRFAEKTGCTLIEDDYDSEFRYAGLPLNSLFELDSSRVVYVGTFSKTLFPSLRLGWLVLPRLLAEQVTELKRLGDHHTNSLSQLAMMRFIDSGDMERHVRRMMRVYTKRRDALITLLTSNFAGKVRIIGEAAGMHIVAEFPEIDFTAGVLEKIEKAGVGVIPVEEHATIKGRHHRQLILGYAHLEPAVIEKGVLRLRQALFETGSHPQE